MPAVVPPPTRVEVIGNELAVTWGDGRESFLDLRKAAPQLSLRDLRRRARRARQPQERPRVSYGPHSFELRAFRFVGGYAFQPTWNDGHDTGLYTFPLSCEHSRHECAVEILRGLKLRRPSPASGPRRPATPRAKREELSTYRELELGRELKSIRQRRRIEARGKLRVIGEGTADRPLSLRPGRALSPSAPASISGAYWSRPARSVCRSAPTVCSRSSPRASSNSPYAQLADEARHETARHMSPSPRWAAPSPAEEQDPLCRHARAGGQSSLVTTGPAATALDQALGAIERRQNHNPARYQAIWAELVGPDAAVQSQLHRIDPATQTAWIRCHNSVLSADLQRRRGLPEKLTKALGVPVRQLRASF